ncbi:hypothetical protein CP533_1979 [Ophiocordyceps camponoti-saundersi (nom. inval.)]|nr:hypothetical protein CP533_1979 [Ophiocordyceps camponoti-saundersi (nom. inval.)]
MPRALCSWQLRHPPFICVSCRLRLSFTLSHLPRSRNVSSWSRNVDLWVRALKLLRPSRQLSVSAPLHDAADNGGAAKPRRALGAFAKSSGGAGAFANKGIGPMASADKLGGFSPANVAPVLNGLLPHELAARESLARKPMPHLAPTSKPGSQNAPPRVVTPITRSNLNGDSSRPEARPSRPAASGTTSRWDPQSRSSPSQSRTGSKQQLPAQGTPFAAQGFDARSIKGQQQQQQQQQEPMERRQPAAQSPTSWTDEIVNTVPVAAIGGQSSPATKTQPETRTLRSSLPPDNALSSARVVSPVQNIKPSRSWTDEIDSKIPSSQGSENNTAMPYSQKLDSWATDNQRTRPNAQAPSPWKFERRQSPAQTRESQAVGGRQPPVKPTWSDAKTPDSWADGVDQTMSTAAVLTSSIGDKERSTENTPPAILHSVPEAGSNQQPAQNKPLAATRPRGMGSFSQRKASVSGPVGLADAIMPWRTGWGALQHPGQPSEAAKKTTAPETTQEPKTTPASVDKPASPDPQKLTDFWNQFDNYSSSRKQAQDDESPHNDMRGTQARDIEGHPTDEWQTSEQQSETLQTIEQHQTKDAQNMHLHEERLKEGSGREQQKAGSHLLPALDFSQKAKARAISKKQQKRKNKNSIRQDEDYEEEGAESPEEKQQRRAQKEAAKAAKRLAEEEARSVKKIFIPEFINLHELANALKLPFDSFMRDLEHMGFENLSYDTIMTGETAGLVAAEYDFQVTVDMGAKKDLRSRPLPEDLSSLPNRPPVVTIMGHVDHGKTTLLDRLRQSSVAAQEHGGITQHIGAFVVKMSSGKTITFLDTPGHAAFLSMRQRGANVTDMVVLVVAADDSVMPQTVEALKHAKNAKVPIIVAINKVDKPQARVDQVMRDLASHGVQLEEFGGDVQAVRVSGKTGKGMDELEESIVVQSELLELRTETDGLAEGWVIESSVKTRGKSATVLVKRGTLRPGDIIVAGTTWARVRLMLNEAGAEMNEAPPATPAEILGWRELPSAGERVLQAPDEETARTAVQYRLEMADRAESSLQLAEHEQRLREQAAKKAAEEEAATAAAEAAEAAKKADEPPPPPPPQAPSEPGVQYQNFIIRADVIGSVEAVCGIILELGNNEVRPRVLRSSAGQVSEFDVDQAAISKAIIISFNVPILPHIRQRAASADVRIMEHNIIYRIADDVTTVLEDMLPPLVSHRVVSEVDVLQIFSINVRKRIMRNIAGCRVRNGVMKKTSKVKVLRKGEVIFDGVIDTFRHGKKDVESMGKGSECGIGLQEFDAFEIDDQIQGYEVVVEKRTLGGRRTE